MLQRGLVTVAPVWVVRAAVSFSQLASCERMDAINGRGLAVNFAVPDWAVWAVGGIIPLCLLSTWWPVSGAAWTRACSTCLGRVGSSLIEVSLPSVSAWTHSICEVPVYLPSAPCF